MEIRGVEEWDGSPAVFLSDTSGESFLIISISEAQATALRVALGGYPFPRPLTHDLLLAALDSAGWRVEKVVINDLKDNVFYAQVFIKKGKTKKVLDARPSDALNIAARVGCPIYATEDVIKRFLDDLYEELRKLQERIIVAPGTRI